MVFTDGTMTVEDGEKSPTYANMKMLGFSQDYSSSLSSPEELYKEFQGFHVNMSQFREPPPYPGPPKQSSQSGLRQSFSGSEASTDVSVSSTENLPSCHRQEPQGEETQVTQSCLPYDVSRTSSDSEYSILARLGMPTSGMEGKSQNTPQIYVTGNTNANIHGPHFATSPVSCLAGNGMTMGQNLYVSSESGFSSASTSSSKLTLPETCSNTNMNFTTNYSTPNTNLNFTTPTSGLSYSNSTLYANYPTPVNQLAMHDPSQIHSFTHYPHMFPQQVTGQMVPQYISSLPPPPEYPGPHNPDLLDQSHIAKRSYELLGKPDVPGSRSQPDLSHFWERSGTRLLNTTGSGSDKGSQQSLEQSMREPRMPDIESIAAQATSMVEVLSDENKSLREKLNAYDRKVSKLLKFELEIQKVHEGYEKLVKSSEKRERLEQIMRKRLEDELRNLKAMNNSLIRQLEGAGITVPEKVVLASTEPVDSSMATLLAKHKELLTVKEQQDLEIEAHLVTIQEQRAQIDILRNIQTSPLRIDEETRKQQIISEYDKQIQEELTSIKAGYEKAEQMEKQIRLKLEQEVEYCRHHHLQAGKSKPFDSLQQKAGKSKVLDTKRDLSSDVKRMLDEKEAKILQLEKEVIKWKTQHLEDSIRRLKLQESSEGSGDSLLTPRAVPPYEQVGVSSVGMNTESLINEAKTDKLKHMEEVYQANRKVAELEASVKSLKSQLAEKDATLRVYQRSPMTRSSSVHTIYCTPHHSPRPSLIAAMGTTGSLSRQSSQDGAAGSGTLEIRHKKTGSTSALELCSRASQDELFEKIKGLHDESKNNSDEDSQRDVWQV